jgi:hypothetical protein
MSPDDDVIAHMQRHFGPVDKLALTEILPVTGIRIHVVRGNDPEDPTVLFTTGMSARAQKVPRGSEDYRYTELLVRVPAEWSIAPTHPLPPEHAWPIQWLRKMAWYPHEHHTWLGGPFTIVSNGEPPEPLGSGTELSCLLLACEADDLNPVRCGDGRSIYLFSLIPLYAEERDLERADGIRALLERFAAHGVSFVIDPSRPNVAT